MSLDRERAKRTLIYYAYPAGQRYGYFTSTREDVWREYLRQRNGEPE